MQMKKLKDLNIAFVITTYNKIEDAKGQMDLIRNIWEPLIKQADIYHEYNGEKDWYPKKYKETVLSRHPSLPHLEGAVDLINKGIADVLSSKKPYDYIVVASADVWIYNPQKVKNILTECLTKHMQLATSLWHGPVFSTEFFIITPDVAKQIFPLPFSKFVKKYPAFLSFAKKTTFALVELYFTYRYLKLIRSFKKIYLIPGRKLVTYRSRFSSKNFYASHHNMEEKRKYIATHKN